MARLTLTPFSARTAPASAFLRSMSSSSKRSSISASARLFVPMLVTLVSPLSRYARYARYARYVDRDRPGSRAIPAFVPPSRSAVAVSIRPILGDNGDPVADDDIIEALRASE